MKRQIKCFDDNSVLEYDRGGFDDWCVYLKRPGVPRFAPKDVDYFHRLQVLSAIHGSKIYSDFVSLYNITAKSMEQSVLDFISNLSSKYGSDGLEIDILFTILYAGMVAEENKANTKLGKRVKRLGMHQVLIENLPAHNAANFSRGMGWREIAKECEKRGF